VASGATGAKFNRRRRGTPPGCGRSVGGMSTAIGALATEVIVPTSRTWQGSGRKSKLADVRPLQAFELPQRPLSTFDLTHHPHLPVTPVTTVSPAGPYLYDGPPDNWRSYFHFGKIAFPKSANRTREVGRAVRCASRSGSLHFSSRSEPWTSFAVSGLRRMPCAQRRSRQGADRTSNVADRRSLPLHELLPRPRSTFDLTPKDLS
jgi:hypothetical protein